MVTFRGNSGGDDSGQTDSDSYKETNVPFFRKNVKQSGGTSGPDLSGDPLIHPSFPPMGMAQPAHKGSQSSTPDKDPN
jgi:hypothetical protein